MPLKRHVALQDLSRDHQRFLLEARHIRWLVGKDPRAATLPEVKISLLGFWDELAVQHMKEEEEILLPFCLKHNPDLKLNIDKILNEHAWMRERVAAVKSGSAEDDHIILAKIAQKIHEHVRYEERCVFSYIQSELSDSDLAALHSALQAARQQMHADIAAQQEA